MWIDAECKIVNDPHRDERLFWENHALSRVSDSA